VVGITEALVKLPRLIRSLARARALLRALRPDLVVLIDFPDFNLALAAQAKRLNLPVLYYVSPQVWAWRSGRIDKIKRLVDHMALILPFEADLYRAHQVPATFVGHPLLDEQGDAAPPLPVERSGGPVIGLLPGSRDKEVARLLPVMLAAAERLVQTVAQVRFVLSVAPTVDRAQVVRLREQCGAGIDLEIYEGPVRDIFGQADLVVAASGTVTLEAALAAVPMVIVYKVSRLSYWLGKVLVGVDAIGLPNLIAGSPIVPELIQDQANADTLAATVGRLLDTPQSLARMREALAKVRALLGGPGASAKVAAIGLEMMAPEGAKLETGNGKPVQ